MLTRYAIGRMNAGPAPPTDGIAEETEGTSDSHSLIRGWQQLKFLVLDLLDHLHRERLGT